MSATGVLDCLDGADGSKIWSVDVPSLVGISQITSTNSVGLEYTEEDSALAWGRSTSPLIYNDIVIVPAGGLPKSHPNFDEDKSSTMIAFDKLTGDEVWRGGNRMIAYGSPSVRTVLGRDQILLSAEDHAVGHDPETGEELWAFERPGGSNAGGPTVRKSLGWPATRCCLPKAIPLVVRACGLPSTNKRRSGPPHRFVKIREF